MKDSKDKYIDYDNMTGSDISSSDEETVIQKVQRKSSKKKANDRNIYKCKKCEFSSQSECSLNDHNKNVPEDSRMSCNKCDYITRNNDMLKRHMTNAHCTNNIECSKCNHIAPNEKMMQHHIEGVHIEKSFKCKECDFKAINETILKKHMNIAMGHSKQIICKYFLKNQCRFGEEYRFIHEKSSEQCKYFDRCRSFPQCKFNHFEICRFQERCKNGRYCRYVHLQQTFLGFQPLGGRIFHH